MSRRTIARPAALDGVGLHLGRGCRLTFRPGECGAGIVFERADLPGRPRIPARVENVSASERRTQIGAHGADIHTVEHVLAAVSALQLDDLVVEMDGPEPPILDGSALPFFTALRDAGVTELTGEPDLLEVSEPIRIIDGASIYEAYPCAELRLDVTIEFPHPLIARQRGEYSMTPQVFERELAGARTFGFVNEVDALRAKGLIAGASPQNVVVLGETGVVQNELRWPDEFVRHKTLDCVGDLLLSGAHVRARIVAVRPSHRGTVTLVREMVKAAGRSTIRRQETRGVMDIDEIMKVLPHRYPFLLVDRILEIEPRVRVVGVKNVSINEPFFQGHFPGHPIMPGVLIVEAMAQVGGMLLLGSVDAPQSKVVYFMSLDNVKFRRPVRPGDQIRFELEVVQIRGRVCKMRGVARVDGEIVTEADMAAMVRDR